MALTATVYFMVLLITSSAKECGLKMKEKLRNRPAFFTKTDIKLFQTECMEESCHQSNGGSKKIEKMDGSSAHQENQPKAPRQCGKKVCSHNSRCVEDGCQKICVQSPSFSELHSASESGVISKVKAILTKGRADINCKKWIGRTPVMVAAEKGHRSVVEFLVSNGADMSVVDNYGMNILQSACLGGDTEVVKYVLSKEKVDINGQVGCGGTPVMLAARHGHKEVVELLVNKGADLSLTDKRGWNILHATCWGGHMEVVKYVLSQDVININSVDLSRKTPVMVAEERGLKDVVDLLLSKGDQMPQVKTRRKKRKKKIRKKSIHGACRRGSVEAVKHFLEQDNTLINYQGTPWRSTPVITAARSGHKEVVDFLISKGADMTLVDKIGRNVLHVACLGGFVEMVKHILSKNIFYVNSIDTSGRTPVMSASEKGHKEVVQFLLSRGADTSLVNKNSNNILHLACRGGNVEMVKYILKQVDVGINSRGSNGMTPLIVAANNGRMEIFELLVNKGANKSLVDKSGNNILHAASRGGNVEMVKYILKQVDVGINSRGSNGMTPLIVAANNGHMEIFELLVNKGANKSLVDKSGNNILHAACRGGNVEMVKYILKQVDVGINSRGSNGMTPLIVAANNGHMEVFELLVNKRANKSLVDESGNNILHAACRGGNIQVVKYVLSLDLVDIYTTNEEYDTAADIAEEYKFSDILNLF